MMYTLALIFSVLLASSVIAAPNPRISPHPQPPSKRDTPYPSFHYNSPSLPTIHSTTLLTHTTTLTIIPSPTTNPITIPVFIPTPTPAPAREQLAGVRIPTPIAPRYLYSTRYTSAPTKTGQALAPTTSHPSAPHPQTARSWMALRRRLDRMRDLIVGFTRTSLSSFPFVSQRFESSCE
jgi:hypothetical protein